METKQNNQRSNAMRWWNNKSIYERSGLCNVFFKGRQWQTLTGREIESIYNSQDKGGNKMYNEARESHYKDYKSANFPFLNDSEDNIDTYACGWAAAADFYAKKWEVLVKDMEKTINSLQNTTV